MSLRAWKIRFVINIILALFNTVWSMMPQYNPMYRYNAIIAIFMYFMIMIQLKLKPEDPKDNNKKLL